MAARPPNERNEDDHPLHTARPIDLSQLSGTLMGCATVGLGRSQLRGAVQQGVGGRTNHPAGDCGCSMICRRCAAIVTMFVSPLATLMTRS